MAILDQRVKARMDGVGLWGTSVTGSILGIVREEVWQWYYENEEDELLRVRKWFFSFSVRVKHLRPLFVKLFGPPRSESESLNPFTS